MLGFTAWGFTTQAPLKIFKCLVGALRQTSFVGAPLLITLALCLLVFAPQAQAQEADAVLHVPADYPTIAAAIDAATNGSTVLIASGEYNESLVITRSLILRGVGEVTLRGVDDAPVIYIHDTDAVWIENFTITGGQYGVSVLRSRRVTIQNNIISENRLLGVRVRMASAHILANTITDTQPPYGRGIHVSNTSTYPETRIVGNHIAFNALAGIASNMALSLYIADNVVSDNAHRGIAVMEMSRAVVVNNVVQNNDDTGIYITDQSTAILCGNIVTNSQFATIVGSGRYGNGITVDYGSQVELSENTVSSSANYGVSILSSSFVTLNDNTLHDNIAGTIWIDDTSETVSNAISTLECG